MSEFLLLLSLFDHVDHICALSSSCALTWSETFELPPVVTRSCEAHACCILQVCEAAQRLAPHAKCFHMAYQLSGVWPQGPTPRPALPSPAVPGLSTPIGSIEGPLVATPSHVSRDAGTSRRLSNVQIGGEWSVNNGDQGKDPEGQMAAVRNGPARSVDVDAAPVPVRSELLYSECFD
jgi:hypothetical protein